MSAHVLNPEHPEHIPPAMRCRYGECLGRAHCGLLTRFGWVQLCYLHWYVLRERALRPDEWERCQARTAREVTA